MHAKRLVLLVIFLILACFAFMTIGVKGSWNFILPFRGTKLAALLVVGIAVSSSTVLFQTITQNHVLTPSIMGFDALYILILTAAVYFLGGQNFVQLPDIAVFLVNVGLMVCAALALFGTLLGTARNDLMRLVLTGIVFATLFRSLTFFMQRMIDPNEYAVVQGSSFANFNGIDPLQLMVSAGVTAVALLLTWLLRHRLDVLALGRETAISLGEEPERLHLQALILIAVLVSISTAFVGPTVFLGLIVVSLARLLTPSPHHATILLSSGLVSGIVIVSGQTLMERVLALSTPLTVVIDFVGGILFIALLLKRRTH